MNPLGLTSFKENLTLTSFCGMNSTVLKLIHFFFQLIVSYSKTYIPNIELTTPLDIIGFHIRSNLVKTTSNSTCGIVLLIFLLLPSLFSSSFTSLVLILLSSSLIFFSFFCSFSLLSSFSFLPLALFSSLFFFDSKQR